MIQTNGDVLSFDESFGAPQQLAPARFVFDDENLDEASVTVAVNFFGMTLTEGVEYAIDRTVPNQILVTFLVPLGTLGPLSQAGDPMIFDLTTIVDLAGNPGAPVNVTVTYDERPPTATRLDTMRRLHQDQTERLSKLVTDNGKWTQLLVVLLSLTFFAIAGILAVLALK